MKELYERPMIAVEEFIVNRAIAACGDETGRDVVFDCMIGPNRDITNVLTTNCRREAGTTNLTTASATNSHSHSNYTGGNWSNRNGTCTYTAPDDAIGLIYFCSSCGTASYRESNNVLTHNTRHNGQYHVQIAPLYGTSIEEVNVGS